MSKQLIDEGLMVEHYTKMEIYEGEIGEHIQGSPDSQRLFAQMCREYKDMLEALKCVKWTFTSRNEEQRELIVEIEAAIEKAEGGYAHKGGR